MKFFKEHKWVKVLLIILIIILILFLIVFGVSKYVSWKLQEGTAEVVKEEDISTEELLSDTVPIIETEQTQSDVINVLVIGSDSRDPDSDNGRSDTMMLLSFNKAENKATLVSFLRDSLVEVPGHGTTKLGHSYAYGGAGLTVNTINQVYGLDIQNYITVNFEDLENIIDKIGGIEVNITAAEAKLYNSYGLTDITEGMNVLDGHEALRHSRNRSIDNDFGRTRRQRDVMYGIYKKVMQNKDMDEIMVLIRYCLTQVKTNMTLDKITDLATAVLAVENLEVQQTSIPADGTYTFGTYNGMSVVNVDIEANRKILEELLY